MRYPLEQAREEVAFIAYHFHWARNEIMKLPHLERRNWVKEISGINETINKESTSQAKG